MHDAVVKLLRSSTEQVVSQEEAGVLVRTLEKFIPSYLSSLSCPEIHIKKQAAIIRYGDIHIDLIDPHIIATSDPVISHNELCHAFPDRSYNCYRYKTIEVTTGIEERRKTIKVSDDLAILIQHQIDHMQCV